jgi:rod shape-determining protein MreD
VQVLRFSAALAAVVLVHLAGSWAWSEFPRALDLFVVLVVANAREGRSLRGLVGGMVAGLAHDVLSGGPYGLFGIADTILGYFTARAAQRVIIERASMVLLVVAAATLAQQAILMALQATVMEQAEPPAPLWWGGKAAATGLVAFGLDVGAGALRRSRERRRFDRVDRLRFPR